MAKNVDNLIMGVGSLYIAEFGSAEPGAADIGSEPGADWKDVGFTQDGVTLTFTQEFEELEVDQIVDVPGRRLTKREMTIETNLAEATLENLDLALNSNGTLTDETGTQSWELSTSQSNVPVYHAILFDGFAPNGQRRRVVVRRALQTGDVESVYSKDGQTVFAVEFSAHYVSESVSPLRITDGVA